MTTTQADQDQRSGTCRNLEAGEQNTEAGQRDTEAGQQPDVRKECVMICLCK